MARKAVYDPEVSLRASDLEREWMGGYTEEPIIFGGRIGSWNWHIYQLANAFERYPLFEDVKYFRDEMEKYRKEAAGRFGQSGEEGERYQESVAAYFACKLCRLRRERKQELTPFLMDFSREQIADRIVEAHFDDFKTFFTERYFQLSGSRKTEENAEALALLEKARDRYELHVKYRETKETVERRERELDEIPFYRRCREALEQLEQALEKIRGEKLSEGELGRIISRMGTEASIYNQHHEQAEAAAKKLRERSMLDTLFLASSMEHDLNLEIPLVNPACEALIRRLQEKRDPDADAVLPLVRPMKPTDD